MMSWRSFKPLLAVAVSLLAMAALVPAASADPITYIDGTNGQFTLTSNGTTATITFVDNNVTQLNHQLVPNKMTLFATMSILTTPGASPFGTIYTFSPSSYPDGEVINGLPAGVTGTASFNLHGLTALVPGFAPDTLILLGSKTLDPNGTTTTLDFSPFAEPGASFVFTLNASSSFNSIIQGGGTLQGSGSFSESAAPEPASAVILGIGVLMLGSFSLYRKKKLATR